MPFKSAYLWVIALIALSLFAFWRAYLGVFSSASIAYHVHGLSAFAWMVLLAAQSWLVHKPGKLPLHRKLGMASLFLFPIFMAGSFLIIHSMAFKTAGSAALPAQDGLFYDAFGARLGLYDIIGSAAFAFFFARAIRHRRNVQVHARYLLATALLLLGPALGRVLPIPFLAAGWEFVPSFELGLRITLGLAVAIAVIMARNTTPAGKAAGQTIAMVLALGWAGFELAAFMPAWRPIYETLGALDASLLAIAGLVLGSVIAWWAWEAGKRPAARKTRAGTAAA